MVTFHAPSDTESYLSVEEETNMADNAVLPPNMDFEATPATHVDLARTIELMQARINQLESAQEHRSPPPPAAPPSPQVKRPRPTQGDPEPYDHTKPELFPQFESKLQSKLIIDAAAIGGPYEQLWYAFGRLKDYAAARIHPWMEIYGKDRHGVSEGTLDMFFEEMRFAFKDPQLQQKALARLNTLRQGKRDFREFLGEFEQLLLEAGGHGWDNNVKRGFLDAAINQDMRKALISVERKTELTAYCRQLQEVAIRIEEFNRIENTRVSRRARPAIPPTRPPAFTPQKAMSPGPDPMDWASAGADINAVKPRAKLVPAGEVEARRREGRCLRCGASGHFISRCPYRAPVKPAARVTATQIHQPELDLEDDTASVADETKNE